MTLPFLWVFLFCFGFLGCVGLVFGCLGCFVCFGFIFFFCILQLELANYYSSGKEGQYKCLS